MCCSLITKKLLNNLKLNYYEKFLQTIISYKYFKKKVKVHVLCNNMFYYVICIFTVYGGC